MRRKVTTFIFATLFSLGVMTNAEANTTVNQGNGWFFIGQILL